MPNDPDDPQSYQEWLVFAPVYAPTPGEALQQIGDQLRAERQTEVLKVDHARTRLVQEEPRAWEVTFGIGYSVGPL